MNLSEQCAHLGVGLHVEELVRTADGWHFDNRIHRRPEAVAAAQLASRGWTCASCEGGPILVLMQSACLPRLMEWNQFGAKDSLTRYFEAQVTINESKAGEIVEAIGNASRGDVVRAFEMIYATTVQERYPGLSRKLIDQLFSALQFVLPEIATIFVRDPYAYRAGWPDITAVQESQVRFLEIKTSDKLHEKQIKTISELLLPTGLDVGVVQLRKSRDQIAHD